MKPYLLAIDNGSQEHPKVTIFDACGRATGRGQQAARAV